MKKNWKERLDKYKKGLSESPPEVGRRRKETHSELPKGWPGE